MIQRNRLNKNSRYLLDSRNYKQKSKSKNYHLMMSSPRKKSENKIRKTLLGTITEGNKYSHESTKDIQWIIPFSSELENLSEAKSKQEWQMSEDNSDDFDEDSSVVDKLQIYNWESIHDAHDELRASKGKMNYDSLQQILMPPGTRKIWSAKVTHNSRCHTFYFSDTKTGDISPKEIPENERSEIPEVLNREEESIHPLRKSRQGLLKYTEFTDPKISSMIRSKEKSWLLIDTLSELEPRFKMIWKTLATDLQITNDLSNALKVVEKTIE
jgi:hypothetical protein